jgi:uncharacterized membrane protein
MAAVAAGRARILAVTGLVLVPVAFHFIIVATGHLPTSSRLSLAFLFRFSFVTVSAITHWAIYAGLLITFAVTLRPKREALLTTMAGKLHGPLSAEVTVYTRQATFAWCIFFAGQLAASVTLFFFAPLVVWSFFVNVLDIPLVLAMFAAEYFFRIHWLRNPPRQSLSAIVNVIATIRKPREEWAGSP